VTNQLGEAKPQQENTEQCHTAWTSPRSLVTSPSLCQRYVHTEAAKIALLDPKIQKSNSPVALLNRTSLPFKCMIPSFKVHFQRFLVLVTLSNCASTRCCVFGSSSPSSRSSNSSSSSSSSLRGGSSSSSSPASFLGFGVATAGVGARYSADSPGVL